MKFLFPILVGSSLLVAFAAGGQSAGSTGPAHRDHSHFAKPHLAAPPADKLPFHRPLLTTEALAIAVAEPILFSIYGRENIIRQRPYSVRLLKRCWHLSGRLPGPASAVGGTFYLVIEAGNCRVQTLFHTK